MVGSQFSCFDRGVVLFPFLLLRGEIELILGGWLSARKLRCGGFSAPLPHMLRHERANVGLSRGNSRLD